MIDPEIARMRGTLAAHSRWASEPDRTSATAKMRAGFLGKLQREAREELGPGATDEQVAKLADNALQSPLRKDEAQQPQGPPPERRGEGPGLPRRHRRRCPGRGSRGRRQWRGLTHDATLPGSPLPSRAQASNRHHS